jgi:O-succinylbenzoate synthase
MKLQEIELRTIHLPLVRPFRTSFGTQTSREVLMVKVTNENGTAGWAECVAMSEPLYSPEYVIGCLDFMKRFLIPALRDKPSITAEDVPVVLKPFLGGQMAKAALETAILDAQLKDQGISLAKYLGATKTKVECGVSVGIANNLEALVEEVKSYVDAGYRRIKLKIEPGWDYEAVKTIRQIYPDIPLQVDANQAYSRSDGKLLAKLY